MSCSAFVCPKACCSRRGKGTGMEEFWHAIEMLYSTPVVPAALGGLIWGMLGGATPGLSASITMALLLPFTYTLAPMPAIVMLATCYIGAEYGGSIPAILIRTPGTNASAATMLDGYEMNRQGRAGEALGISLWSGVVGGLVRSDHADPFDRALVAARAAVQTDDLFRARYPGPIGNRVALEQVVAQGHGRSDSRPDGCDNRDGPGFRRQPLYLRSARSAGWHPAALRDGGALRRDRTDDAHRYHPQS